MGKENPVRVGFADSYKDLRDLPSINGVTLREDMRLPKTIQTNGQPQSVEDCIAGDKAFDPATGFLYICYNAGGDTLAWGKVAS